MRKISKRYQDLSTKFDSKNFFGLSEGIGVVQSLKSTKFDETVDIAVRLAVDPRHADQMIRGSVVLPHGTGKTLRVGVFAKGAKLDEAKESGADVYGSDDLAEEILAGNINFDILIATPDMMATVGKLGRVLGPKGLMPNPKVGTVTMDVSRAIRDAKNGQVTYKVDKKGIIHAGIGKVSFSPDQLKDNACALIGALNKQKPSASKGRYIKSSHLALTMSPSVSLDVSELLDIR